MFTNIHIILHKFICFLYRDIFFNSNLILVKYITVQYVNIECDRIGIGWRTGIFSRISRFCTLYKEIGCCYFAFLRYNTNTTPWRVIVNFLCRRKQETFINIIIIRGINMRSRNNYL